MFKAPAANASRAIARQVDRSKPLEDGVPSW
jgi:hypothetical protein